jgi:16S rRNA (uracil1498-N3)-methyltransferase
LHNGLNLRPLEDVLPGAVLSLFVGPEGGWSDGELEMARESGLAFASLGPYRLRSETAGIVAVGRTCAVLYLSRSVGGSR